MGAIHGNRVAPLQGRNLPRKSQTRGTCPFATDMALHRHHTGECSPAFANAQ